MENSYKEVLKEVDHLVAMIEQSEEYQTYRSLEEKMFQNKELMRVIREIKKKEQELAKKEQFGTSSEKEKKVFLSARVFPILKYGGMPSIVTGDSCGMRESARMACAKIRNGR